MYKVTYVNVGSEMVTKDVVYHVDTDVEMMALVEAECRDILGCSFTGLNLIDEVHFGVYNDGWFTGTVDIVKMR